MLQSAGGRPGGGSAQLSKENHVAAPPQLFLTKLMATPHIDFLPLFQINMMAAPFAAPRLFQINLMATPHIDTPPFFQTNKRLSPKALTRFYFK